jgi:hypothetical protein
MVDDGEGSAMDKALLDLPDGGTRVGGGVEDRAIAKALSAKASIAALRKLRRNERLRAEADATMWKKSQQARTLENLSKKRPREKETIAKYFLSARNFDTSATTEKENVPTPEIGINEVLAAAATDQL